MTYSPLFSTSRAQAAHGAVLRDSTVAACCAVEQAILVTRKGITLRKHNCKLLCAL